MKRTHKKILGFAGLGLVAAVTTFAATVQVPGVSALESVSDKIQVRVLSGDPEVGIISTGGSETTSPNYSFTVGYNNITSLKVDLVNRNADGTVIWSGEIFNEAVSGAGEQPFNLNLDDYNGKGNFTITITGMGEGAVPVEQILSVAYKDAAPTPVEPEDDKPTVDPDVPEAVTKTVTVNIYDIAGDLVKTVTKTDPASTESVDLTSLPAGTYTMEVITKDKNGNVTSVEVSTIVIGGEDSTPIDIDGKGGAVDHVIIRIKDSTGAEVQEPAYISAIPAAGETIDFDFGSLPSGVYTIITEYYNDGDELIDTVTKTITISVSGQVDVDVTTEVDTVTTVEAYIYDANGKLARIVRADRATGKVSVYDPDGKLLFTLDNAYSDSSFTIPMDGLAYGDYTGTIMYRNADGKLVGDAKPIRIKYNGKAIIVPDTGSFFQGLNISREDYLITGLIVFAVIGVAGFAFVKIRGKNRR